MMCEDYLISFHKLDLKQILENEHVLQHFSININFLVLYDNQPNLGLELLKGDSDKCLSEWDSATLRAQMAVMKEVDTRCELKVNVHCRIYQLPGWSYVNRTIFPNKRDVGKFLQISGTVMRISAAKLLEYQRCYLCVKCKVPIIVKADYERKYMIKEPKVCSNVEGCSGKQIVKLGEIDNEKCKDYQEIKIQEKVKELGVGTMPSTMLVTLEDDLVDTCKPGDNVTICGIVMQRWGEFIVGKKNDIDITLKANYLQVDNIGSSAAVSTPEITQIFNSFWENYSENHILGRDTILASFCPQIYGLYWVKLAIAIILAGGSSLEDTTLTGVRTRSESHLLLVGDPGTGKSQLLRFASKIIPRSILTTGVGSTAAGLTVSATMEHGEWQLEGGALLMADGGICCIDEFNSMKEHDRTSIHEAMEQQTISVAKASMVCKFNTRCSILAACNPKGNIDPYQPLCMSIALPSPLLSRFDLVLILRDTVNEEWDSLVSDYILNGCHNLSKLTTSKLWSTDLLQMYFVMIKKRFNPKLSDDAERVLSSYYQIQRRLTSRNKARTTVRLLESLVRLSQGHARLMYRDVVEVIDCVYAIILVDTAMEMDSSILNLNINLNSIFPESPLNDCRDLVQNILNKLSLPDILNKEMKRLEKFKDNRKRSRFFQRNNDNHNNHTSVGVCENTSEQTNDEGYITVGGDISNLTNQKTFEEPPVCSKSLDTTEIMDSSRSRRKKNKLNSNCENFQPSKKSKIISHSTKKENLIKNVPVEQTNQEEKSDLDKIVCNNIHTSTQHLNEIHLQQSVDKRTSQNGDETIIPPSLERTKKEQQTRRERPPSIITSNELNILPNKYNSFITYQNVDQNEFHQPLERNENGHELKSIALNTKSKYSILDQFKYKLKSKDNTKESYQKSIILDDKPNQHFSQSITNVDQTSNKSPTTLLEHNIVPQKSFMGKPNSSDSVQNDLNLLKLMPGVNDDFNVDLDFDWDNFKPAVCLSSTMISTASSEKEKKSSTGMFEEETVNLDFNI